MFKVKRLERFDRLKIVARAINTQFSILEQFCYNTKYFLSTQRLVPAFTLLVSNSLFVYNCVYPLFTICLNLLFCYKTYGFAATSFSYKSHCFVIQLVCYKTRCVVIQFIFSSQSSLFCYPTPRFVRKFTVLLKISIFGYNTDYFVTNLTILLQNSLFRYITYYFIATFTRNG